MPQTAAEQAARWNARYAEAQRYVFGTEPTPWLRAQVHRWAPGQRILCEADGEGRNSVFLAEQGLEVDAFDISEAAVAKARRLARQRGVTVRHAVADGQALDWPAALYDGVVALFVQYATPTQRQRQFANWQHTLKPGGLLVLQGYTVEQLAHGTGGPADPSHLYTEAMLREAFAGMELLQLEAYEDELREGDHAGLSALVGLVARKR